MKGRCNECNKLSRRLAKVETDQGQRFICRACRRLLRREYPYGAQLENHLTPEPKR